MSSKDYSSLVSYEKVSAISMNVGSGEKFSDKVSTPLFLEQCHVHVSMKANTFQTTHFLTFVNTTSKVLEGELVFPLPKDSSIHNYGLDVDGVIVDAVPVPKESARVAFETTVRERGPAISVAEKVSSSSNAFKSKIYPMPANGGRRTIKLVVIQNGIDDINQLLHYLPITKPAGLKHLSYSFECFSTSGDSSIGACQVLVRRSNGQMDFIKSEEINSTTDLEGILLIVPKDEALNFVEKDTDSGYYYFSSTFSNLGETLETKELEDFKKISIFYDVSFSRRKSQYKQELKFLFQFFEKNKNLKPLIEVFTFSCSIHERREFVDSMKCLEFLNNQKFDGGTFLPLKEIFDCKTSDFIFLISDGISNFGKDFEKQLDNIDKSNENIFKPIFCFSSSLESSFLILRYLSNKTGGKYFDLSEESVESVIAKISFKTCLKKISFYPKNAIEEIYASEIINNSITVFGKLILPEKEPTIELDFGVKKYSTSIKLNLLKVFEQEDSKIIPLLRTLWAQQKINKLSIFSQKNRNLIEEIGMKYGIVTEHTSLIVLSEFSQFQKYKVTPPKQLKELKKLYLNEIEKEELDEKKRKENKLNAVFEKWLRRIEWHKKDFRKEFMEEVKRKKLEIERKKKELEDRKKREEEEKKKKEEDDSGSDSLENLSLESDNTDFLDPDCASPMSAMEDEPEGDCASPMSGILELESDISDPDFGSPMSAMEDEPEGDCASPMSGMEDGAMEDECSMDDFFICDESSSFSVGSGGLGNRCCEEEVSETISAHPSQPEIIVPSESAIKVKAFEPGEEYLKVISSSGTPYIEYLNQKEKYFDSPSFYLDCSDYFFSLYQKDKKNEDLLETGIRILSNIVELELNNVQLFRIVGYRLDQAEKYEEAKFTFERVLKEKPEEPQSYRDLGLVLEKLGEFEKAVEYLYHVVGMKVDKRFDEIELTSLVELNHALFFSIKSEEDREFLIKKLNIDPRFVYKMDVDIRISMAWDTDMTDIDLHVYDPDDEHCFYSHKETRGGGFISRDFVNGYGPEEFMQKSVFRSGKYRISAKYYASHQQSLTGGTTILCSFFTNYMRKDEKQDLVTLRLNKNKDEVEVCEISFEVEKENEIFAKELFD